MSEPTIGHNVAPADVNPLSARLAEKYKPQLDRRDKLLEDIKRVPDEITDEATAKKALIAEGILDANIKEADKLREAEKEPFLTSGRVVDAWFKEIMVPLKKALDSVTQRRVAFQAQERKAREEAATKAREEAEKAAQEAARAAEKIKGQKTFDKAVEAEKAAQEAKEKAAIAAAAIQAPNKIRAEDVGVTGGFKMEWIGTITDVGKLDLNLLKPYLSLTEIEKAVQKWAKQTKGAKLDGAEFTEIPKGTRR